MHHQALKTRHSQERKDTLVPIVILLVLDNPDAIWGDSYLLSRSRLAQ